MVVNATRELSFGGARATRKGEKLAALIPYKHAPMIYLSAFLKPLTYLTKGHKKFQTWEETRILWSPEEYESKFEELGLHRIKVNVILESFLLVMIVIGVNG